MNLNVGTEVFLDTLVDEVDLALTQIKNGGTLTVLHNNCWINDQLIDIRLNAKKVILIY